MARTDNILHEIVASKRREIAAAAVAGLYSERIPDTPTRPMSKALASSPCGIIAECKRRSPSKGEIHPMAMAEDIVGGYARAGAAACSVLTDTPFFGGSILDLMRARQAVDIPLLRKDFIIDERQIFEARQAGADAILLIAAVLSPSEAERLASTATALGLEVLMEFHSTDELDRMNPHVSMAGVNNRNLTTFATDPELSLRMCGYLPEGVVKVAESGLTSMTEIRHLQSAGYRGFLIGETFMRHPDPGNALSAFLAS